VDLDILPKLAACPETPNPARDEAELNLLQQVQEELEFYFLTHQEQQILLQRYQHEQVRAETLIAGLIEQLESRG
jgi:hypothetical protein